MKFLICTAIILSFSLSSAKTQTYKLENDNLIPIKEQVPHIELMTTKLKARVRIKKFIVTKTAEGVKVKFKEICEFPTTVEVVNLTNGGLVSENVYGSCEAKKNGVKVLVTVSGMVYDSVGLTFADEEKALRRNFFSHLYLESSEILFGLGDFNLGTTRSFPFKHWMSELSTDSPGGNDQTREGFIAAVRYGKE